MCAATVWPGASIDVSVPPLNAIAVGTTNPLLSTAKGLGAAKVTLTGAAKVKPLPISELVVESTTSLVTSWNCVLEEGVEVTMPSIQSPVAVARGSYSNKVNVPFVFRTISRLATCPWTTQEEKFRANLKFVQFGEKTVEEFAVAVMEPRVAVFTVTDCVDAFDAVTTPVISSMKESSPVNKLLAVGGSLLALKTLAAARFTAVTT